MSPRRDRMNRNKRDHGSGHGRGENGNSDNSRSSNEVWTEHVSSSGKKYYYNSICGISQWDKPADWVDPNPRRHRSPDRDTDHGPKRYKENASNHSDGHYRDQQHDSRNNRNSHYSHSDVHVLHDTDTSSGGSTPVQDASCRMRPGNQEAQTPLSMASALPRNLSHQLPAIPATNHSLSVNHCPPMMMHQESVNRHLPLNVLLKSKIEGIQNVGTYGNFSGSDSPMLTASLSKYVSNDLGKHVTGWPAEVLERQAQMFANEAYTLGDLQCMRVCTDLKVARAVVRHVEIQATLQDQKLMYLRQLIESVKDVKSHNSVISADLNG